MSRGRSAAVLLLLAGLTALVVVPTWLTTTGTTALRGDVTVAVSGAQAAPAGLAAAVVLLAAVAAVALVGRAGRWVVVVVVAGAGVLVVAAALAVLTDPAGAAQPVVAAQTGVGRLTGPVRVLPWSYLAVVVGVLDVLGAVAVARASGGWAGPSRRHEVAAAATGAGATPEPDDERAAWDALSRGDDPS